MACTLGSVVMEWKQTLFEIWMLSDDWRVIKEKFYVYDLDLKVSEEVGGGMGMVQHKILDQSNIRRSIN